MDSGGVDKAAVLASVHIGIVRYRNHNLIRQIALLFSVS